jgi:hypothetical protein
MKAMERRIEKLEAVYGSLDREIADLMQQLPPEVVEQIISEIEQKGHTHDC